MANETNTEASSPEVKREQTSAAPCRLSAWWGIAAVLALTFAVYAPTLRYQFVHDDRGQIVENPAVHSWRAVPTYFTAQVWSAVMPEELGNYYRPLFLLWLRINDAIFGNHAWAWHLTTILAHLLTTLLVYLLAWRLGAGRDVALLAALIFGLHPAHIEAVAWISGVTEPLLGILLIASFLGYVQWRRDGARKWMWLSLVLFAFAILEKETALILPGLLLVYEWIFRAELGKRPPGDALSPAGTGADCTVGAPAPYHISNEVIAWGGKALGRIWPYFLLIALYIPARIYALKGFSHTVTPLSAAQLIFTWPSLIAFWIRHLIWPSGLSTFYDFPAVTQPALRNFILPAIVDIAAGLALFACVRKSRPAAFFAVWLALPLIPLLNIRVFIANDFAHDRYLYLPSVGMAVLMAMLLKKVCVGPPRWLGVSASLLIASLGLAAAMSYGTVTESFYFKDNLTFYTYNLARAPNNPDAACNLATVLAEAGRYGPALEKFREIVKRYPNDWTPVYNLALTYYKVGKLPEAEEYFLRAIRIKPNKPDEYFYLGLTLLKSGQTAKAIESVRQAILIRPNGFAYHFALGMMLKTQGDLPGALREFREELANNPGEQAAAAQIMEIVKQEASGKR